jgi:hypothetical protein
MENGGELLGCGVRLGKPGGVHDVLLVWYCNGRN